MTKAQRVKLMAEWWPQACRAQGWNASDRDQRLAVLSQAVGRPLASASDLNHTTDVDQVRRHLQTLADHLPAAMEQEHEAPARRQRVALEQILKCLALYHPDPDGYVREVIRDKFAHGRSNRAARDLQSPLPSIDDLSTAPRHWRRPDGVLIELPSQLEQLLMTITRAVNGKSGFRNQAKHSLHDMYMLADLPCGCRICFRRDAQQVVPAGFVPVEQANPF